MAIVKGLLTVAGVAFVGLVGYKIVKKKRPDMLKKASDIKERVSEVIGGAKESFREGYAQGTL